MNFSQLIAKYEELQDDAPSFVRSITCFAPRYEAGVEQVVVTFVGPAATEADAGRVLTRDRQEAQ